MSIIPIAAHARHDLFQENSGGAQNARAYYGDHTGFKASEAFRSALDAKSLHAVSAVKSPPSSSDFTLTP